MREENFEGNTWFSGGVKGGPIAANRTLREDYRKLTANKLPIRGGGEGGGHENISGFK